MDIQFDLSGIEGIEECLNQSVEKLLEGARVGANKALLKMEADAKAFIDSNNSIVKGQLKESVHAEQADIIGLTIEGEMSAGGETTTGTNVEHAPYVEFGTGDVGRDTAVPNKYPGPLDYHKGKWLAVIPEVGPRWIAGQPAQPFMYPTYVKAQEEAPKLIAEAIKENMKG